MSGKGKKKKFDSFLPFPEGDDLFEGASDAFGLDDDDLDLELDVPAVELDDEAELLEIEEEETDFYDLGKDDLDNLDDSDDLDEEDDEF